MSKTDVDQTAYEVVANNKSQYSIWPAYKELPLGWEKKGMQGDQEACLRFIAATWTNMEAQ
jgi:MbtH protein